MKRWIISIVLLLFAGLSATLPLLAAPSQSTTPTVAQTQPQNGAPAVSPGIAPVIPPGSATSMPANTQQPMTDIHDIRPPIQVDVNPAIYYWGAGGVLAVLLIVLLVFLWRRWRSRKNGQPPEVAATVYETPEEEALRRLAELEQAQSLTPVEYYFLLSALFRRWIQRRFNLDAPEMTTEELLPAMTRAKLPLPMFSDIKSFFLLADQVKFAKAGCDTQTMKRHLQLVQDIVEQASTATTDNPTEISADRPAEKTKAMPEKETAGRAD